MRVLLLGTPCVLPMSFAVRLTQLRREKRLTQQAVADATGVHVNQVKRYEAGSAQPTLETLIGLAKCLHVSLDDLVFEDSMRGPDEDLRLQFEAVRDFTPEEKLVTRTVLDSLILKHTANRFNAAVGR